MTTPAGRIGDPTRSVGDPASAQILLVEDDETLADLVARHLRAHGYDVTIAPTAEAASAALAAGLRPSIVVLDINLPGETGLSLVRGSALRDAGGPPVLVASAMTVSPTRLREAGVAGFLPKPFSLESLVTAIHRLTNPSETR